MSHITWVLTVIALAAYGGAFAYLLTHLYIKCRFNRLSFAALLLLGLSLHAWVLQQSMLSPQGINYDVFNLMSFTSGLMLLLSAIFSLIRPVKALNLLGIPVAALGLIWGVSFSQPNQAIEPHHFGLDLHIILSLSAYAVLLMATIHAVLLWFQTRELKKKQKHRFWVNFLPALQAMESLLFDLLWTGFALLSAALLFGFFTIDHFFAQHLAHKTVFSMISWCVYAVLLIGHHRLGWRGQTAIRFSIWGFALLAIGFIGSKLVLELLLNQ